MKYSETTKNIFKALSEFKKDFKQPLKDADNPYFKSKYVPLENVVQSIDNIAPSKGLSYIQSTISDDNRAGVKTIIIHESGEFIEFDPLYLKADKPTAQGMGSAITYARRYSLSSAFGVASDVDDDGNEASGNTTKNSKGSKVKEPTVSEAITKAKELKQSIMDIKKVNAELVDKWILDYLEADDISKLTKEQWNRAVVYLMKLESRAKAEE